MGDHGIADLEVDHRGTELVDPASRLVAKHVRQGLREVGEHAVDDM